MSGLYLATWYLILQGLSMGLGSDPTSRYQPSHMAAQDTQSCVLRGQGRSEKSHGLALEVLKMALQPLYIGHASQ